MTALKALDAMPVHPIEHPPILGRVGEAIDTYNPLKPVQDRVDAVFHQTVKPYLPKSTQELNKADPAHLNLLDKANLFLDRSDGTTKKAQAVWIAVKFIPRILRSLLSMVYHVIATLIQFLAHPLETLAEIALFLKTVILVLKNPKFYTCAGAGLLGTAVGQGIISPQSIMLYFIAAGLVAFGLLYGTVKSIAEAEAGHRFEAWKEQMWEQLKEMPEAFVLGLLIGLMIGMVERAHLVDEKNPVGQVLGLADDIQPLAPLLSQES